MLIEETREELVPLREVMDLSGKVAIVTGGAGGIGKGIAVRLHEAGADIVIADVNEDLACRTSNELNAKRQGSAYAVKTDVSDMASVQAMVEKTVERYGHVDILVNNAGIFPLAPLAQMDDDCFTKVLSVNLCGVFHCTKAVSDQMKAQGHGGKIINVASVGALHPSMVGLAAYDASKNGVWAFTKNVALELAESKIWVNAIAPGGVATPGTYGMAGVLGVSEADIAAAGSYMLMKRMGVPDDIGKVALFLASDLSSYVTGSLIVADGGMLLK